MAGVKTTVKLDTKRLDNLSKYAAKRTAEITHDEAMEIRADIRSSWSAVSPSSPGESPAMVSGNLDKSIPEPRQVGKGDTPTEILEIKADYADDLEYGTVNMPARPFIRPAFQRAEQRYPKRFKRVVLP
jgi:HK97 gp10 family phage protein